MGRRITKQYVQELLPPQDRTVDRKLREMVQSIKIDRDLSKDQILEGCTFARSITAAAPVAGRGRRRPTSPRTPVRSRSPRARCSAKRRGTPRVPVLTLHSARSRRNSLTNRWGYVMDGMVAMDALSTAADRAARPSRGQVRAPSPRALSNPPTGYLAAAVRQELTISSSSAPKTSTVADCGITTTINKEAQDNRGRVRGQTSRRARRVCRSGGGASRRRCRRGHV
ncbi:MAG: transglycosylase domain-containing protein [Actinomycetales bacterium]|nr:transglycosylase domain-containing protein [Actinomycetales bacterium]